MGTNPPRLRDLVIKASGITAELSFETDRFHPLQGSVIVNTMPEVFTVGLLQIIAENAVNAVARDNAELTDDILLFARLCGQLDGFLIATLRPDGGSIHFATEVAASESARLASMLFGSYPEEELCIGLSLG